MKRLNIIVTAGPTREPIDPVRFISNRSTGAMGLAIARAAKKRRHRVILIDGSSAGQVFLWGHLFKRCPQKPLPTDQPGTGMTARQMRQEVLKNFPRADAVVMAAAVADYRPQKTASSKIKKSKKTLTLKLVRNPDILATLAKRKKDKILVGFALETEGLYANALKKLNQKKLDIIVANLLTKKQDVFGPGRTSVLIIDKDGNGKRLENVSKDKVAEIIIGKIEEIERSRRS